MLRKHHHQKKKDWHDHDHDPVHYAPTIVTGIAKPLANFDLVRAIPFAVIKQDEEEDGGISISIPYLTSALLSMVVIGGDGLGLIREQIYPWSQHKLWVHVKASCEKDEVEYGDLYCARQCPLVASISATMTKETEPRDPVTCVSD
ncbi:hypothetical protein Tco_1033795 [Tanacetum coccineum]